MQISIRTCPATHSPIVQNFTTQRVRNATLRLAHRLRDVEVDVSRETPREGGRYVCRIQATLSEGRRVLVKRDEKDARSAIAATVERFRRSLVRTLARIDRVRDSPAPLK